MPGALTLRKGPQLRNVAAGMGTGGRLAYTVTRTCVVLDSSMQVLQKALLEVTMDHSPHLKMHASCRCPHLQKHVLGSHAAHCLLAAHTSQQWCQALLNCSILSLSRWARSTGSRAHLIQEVLQSLPVCLALLSPCSPAKQQSVRKQTRNRRLSLTMCLAEAYHLSLVFSGKLASISSASRLLTP